MPDANADAGSRANSNMVEIRFRLGRRHWLLPAWAWLAVGVAVLAMRNKDTYPGWAGTRRAGNFFVILEMNDGSFNYENIEILSPGVPRDLGAMRSQTVIDVDLQEWRGGSHPTWGWMGLCDPQLNRRAALVPRSRGVTPQWIAVVNSDPKFALFVNQWADRLLPEWNAGGKLSVGTSAWTVPWADGELYNRRRIQGSLVLCVGLGVFGFGLYSLFVPTRRELRTGYLQQGVCPKCKYAIADLRGDVCPECGEEVSGRKGGEAADYADVRG